MTFILCNVVSLLSPSSLMETPVPSPVARALPKIHNFKSVLLTNPMVIEVRFELAMRYLVDLAKDIWWGITHKTRVRFQRKV